MSRASQIGEPQNVQIGTETLGSSLAEVLVAMRECAIAPPPGLETQPGRTEGTCNAIPSRNQDSIRDWIDRRLNEELTGDGDLADGEATVPDALLAAARAALGRFNIQSEPHVTALARWIDNHVRARPGPVLAVVLHDMCLDT